MSFAIRFTPTIKELVVLKMTISTTWTGAQLKCKTKKILSRPNTFYEIYLTMNTETSVKRNLQPLNTTKKVSPESRH